MRRDARPRFASVVSYIVPELVLAYFEIICRHWDRRHFDAGRQFGFWCHFPFIRFGILCSSESHRLLGSVVSRLVTSVLGISDGVRTIGVEAFSDLTLGLGLPSSCRVASQSSCLLFSKFYQRRYDRYRNARQCFQRRKVCCKRACIKFDYIRLI